MYIKSFLKVTFKKRYALTCLLLLLYFSGKFDLGTGAYSSIEKNPNYRRGFAGKGNFQFEPKMIDGQKNVLEQYEIIIKFSNGFPSSNMNLLIFTISCISINLFIVCSSLWLHLASS